MRAPYLGPMQSLACRLGAHRVKQRRVRRRETGTRSIIAGPCGGCGLMLERTDEGWQELTETVL